MRPSKDDATPAKITEDGTPTIFSFLSQAGMDAAMEAATEGKPASSAKELQSSFDSISLAGPESGEIALPWPQARTLAQDSCWSLTAALLLATDVGGGDTGGAEPDDMFDLDDL